MENEIIPYIEMCQREGVSLQRGMNFGLARNHSVILMSVRPGSPYADRFENDGSTIVTKGMIFLVHLITKIRRQSINPSSQPTGTSQKWKVPSCSFKSIRLGRRPPERIRVYEKLKQGIWSYNGCLSPGGLMARAECRTERFQV